MLRPSGKWSLFFDLDGTIMQSVDDVDPQILAAFHTLRRSGHRVILATGRAPASIPIEYIRSTDAAITLTGALITEGSNTLFQALLSDSYILSMAEFCEKRHIPIFLENARHFCSFGEKEYFIGMDANFYDTATMHLYSSLELTECGESFIKAAISTRSYKLMLKAGWQLPEGLQTYWAGDCVDVVPTGTGKGSSALKVLEHFSLDSHRTICFGDSDNDVELFKACALRVSVGQRSLALTECANFIAGSVEEKGVFNALYTLGFI